MSSGRRDPDSQATVVAVSVGAEMQWSWRIVGRNGHRLLESPRTFAHLGEALEDGRRHVHEAVMVRSGASEPPCD